MTSFSRYEAYGTRPYEWGTDPDRQKANTKEEEKSLGLLNERHRYRDLETGVFLTRDPIGYQDGPNIYCYVHCNPITKFDPYGLKIEVVGTPEYIEKVNAYIEKIASSDSRLDILITDLRKSDNVHTIDMPKKGDGNSNETTGKTANEKNGTGTSSDTKFNPDNHYVGSDKRDPSIGLVHELQHAHDKDKGEMERSASQTGVKNSEERAVRTENIRREDLNEKQRTEYDGKKINNPGPEFSPLTTLENQRKVTAAAEAAEEAARAAAEEAARAEG